MSFPSRAGIAIVICALMALSQWAREASHASSPRATVSQPPRPTLVLFLLIDALRHDHVGGPLTPVLNALAERSFVFENAFATSSWTRSSVASMFTSRYPTSVGVLARDDVLVPEAVTLAEVLHGLGDFACAGVSTNINAGEPFGAAQGFDRFIMPDVSTARSYPGDHLMFPARSVTEAAIAQLRARAPTAERPCFLFLHYTDTHAPYLPHPGVLPQAEPPGRFDGSRHQLDVVDAMPLEDLTTLDRDRIKYLYAADVKYGDAWIGVLLREVASLGLADRTMLVLTADHGEGLWDHGIRNHGRDLYDEMVHVPLIVHYPGMEASDGAHISAPVSLLDLAPTIVAAAGIDSPADFQGHDLRPLTRGEPRDSSLDYIYSEMDFDRVNLECIRHDRLKLIRNRDIDESHGEAYQLFDLDADPHERQNLIDRRPAVRAHLKAALRALRSIASAAPLQRRKMALEQLPEFDLGVLRTLGYISAHELDVCNDHREPITKSP